MPKLYKIRPLVFENEHAEDYYTASTPSYHYVVRLRPRGMWVWEYGRLDGGEGLHGCDSLEDGQAQAQAHYERALSEELEEVVFNLVEDKEDEGPDPEPIV
jgi:hypothetical protein